MFPTCRAIITTVFSFKIEQILRKMSASVLLSKADVASSKKSAGKSQYSARAIARRCLSPPESRTPLAPRRVLFLEEVASLNHEALPNAKPDVPEQY